MKKYLFKPDRMQTPVEEMVNASIHGIGILFSLSALITLTLFTAISGGLEKIIACFIFGLSLTIMYSASTLYHSARDLIVKKRFKMLDHISIYLLIAGTYTPITLVTLPQKLGLSLFAVIWGIALAGVVFKIFATGKFEKISTLLYLLMGWAAIIAAKPLMHAIPLDGIKWLVAGGLFYTVGVIFYVWKRLRFSHAVWHLFVLGGSICHFYAILFYVVR